VAGGYCLGFGLYLRPVASGGVVVYVWWLPGGVCFLSDLVVGGCFSSRVRFGVFFGPGFIVKFGRLRPIWDVDLHCFYLGF